MLEFITEPLPGLTRVPVQFQATSEDLKLPGFSGISLFIPAVPPKISTRDD